MMKRGGAVNDVVYEVLPLYILIKGILINLIHIFLKESIRRF